MNLQTTETNGVVGIVVTVKTLRDPGFAKKKKKEKEYRTVAIVCIDQ